MEYKALQLPQTKYINIDVYKLYDKIRILNYFRLIQDIIFKLSNVVKENQIIILKYLINAKTLAFYLNCLNYQSCCYIANDYTEDKKELNLNLEFLIYVYDYYKTEKYINNNARYQKSLIDNKERIKRIIVKYY